MSSRRHSLDGRNIVYPLANKAEGRVLLVIAERDALVELMQASETLAQTGYVAWNSELKYPGSRANLQLALDSYRDTIRRCKKLGLL